MKPLTTSVYTFSNLIEGGFLYVDKTAAILDLIRPASIPFNAMLPQIPAAVPRCAMVTVENLGDGGDRLHFSTDALRELGLRYFKVFEQLAPQKGIQ